MRNRKRFLLVILSTFLVLLSLINNAHITQAQSGITVQIRNNGAETNQSTPFAYLIKNTGTSAVSGLSVRIYFTLDSTNTASNYVLEKYWDQSGAATVSPPTLASGSTYYFTVSYGTTALAAGSSWEFQTALHLASWATNYDGTNDGYHSGYAFNALPATYTATNNIPAYVNGTRIWGSEPGTPAPTTAPTTAPTKTNTPASVPTNTAVGATATRTPTRTPTRTNTPAVPTATVPPTSGWPTAQGDVAVSATISVTGTFDGGMKRYYGTGNLGTSGQSESQSPIFDLANGATIKNVIIGNPAADGIHCVGTCTIQNVWWEDVGEDAATFRGSSSSLTYLVDGGGAKHASDKVFQHNGAGTLTIRNFQVEDFGKLYRSCGNCSTQYKRNVIMSNITAKAPGSALAGINTNYGDTARFSFITIVGSTSMHICDKYTGNNTGAEPVKIGTGADGVNCIYSASDITYK